MSALYNINFPWYLYPKTPMSPYYDMDNYKFHINDFNRYRNDVYEEFKNNSRCKKQSFIMKKIGQSWKQLTDEQKLNYKNIL